MSEGISYPYFTSKTFDWGKNNMKKSQLPKDAGIHVYSTFKGKRYSTFKGKRYSTFKGKRIEDHIKPLNEPIRISFETYVYLKRLIAQEQEKLEKEFYIACDFIPYETIKESRCRDEQFPSPLEKAHRIFLDQHYKLERMFEELHAAAASTYKDHPNFETRKFWGVEA